jgi:hypothetical protein
MLEPQLPIQASNSFPQRPSKSSTAGVNFQGIRAQNPTEARSTRKRKSTVNTLVNPGYEEHVLDFSTQASSTPKRRGRMDKSAVDKMNAVREVSACWKCKFRKKQVSLGL